MSRSAVRILHIPRAELWGGGKGGLIRRRVGAAPKPRWKTLVRNSGRRPQHRPSPRHIWNSTRCLLASSYFSRKCANPQECGPNPTFKLPRGQSPSLSITLASSFRNSAFYLYVALDRERHADRLKGVGCPFSRNNCIGLVPKFAPFHVFFMSLSYRIFLLQKCVISSSKLAPALVGFVPEYIHFPVQIELGEIQCDSGLYLA